MILYEKDGVTPQTIKYQELLPIIIRAMELQRNELDAMRRELNELKESLKAK